LPSGFAPNATVQIYDDFMTWTNGTTSQSQQTWYTTGASWTTSSGTAAHPGYIGNFSFSSNNAGVSFYSNGTPGKTIILGGGTVTVNWVINIATLSTGSNTYTLRCGIGDTLNADEANGCYLEYSSGENSGNWIMKTASASSRTSTNTSTAVGTGWQNLSVSVNAAASTVTYYVNGVSLGTVTTNIPTTGIAPFIDCVRSAGTVAANTLQVDLFYMTIALTTSR
jgi:hypothetical protein